MIEPILTLTSSVITLVSTIVGVLTEKNNIEKEERIQHSQNQDFRDIQTKGDNSPININTTQVQQSVLIRNNQEFKIRDKQFKENLSRLKGYNKFFWIACPLILVILAYFKQINSFSFVASLCVVIINSYSVSLFFRHFYYRYIAKMKDSGDEQDLPSRILRQIEYSIFPFFIFVESVIIIGFSITRTKKEMDSIYLLIFFIALYVISLYIENLLYQFVICNNIWIISAFLKHFIVIIMILIFTILINDMYNWVILLSNYFAR